MIANFPVLALALVLFGFASTQNLDSSEQQSSSFGWPYVRHHNRENFSGRNHQAVTNTRARVESTQSAEDMSSQPSALYMMDFKRQPVMAAAEINEKPISKFQESFKPEPTPETRNTPSERYIIDPSSPEYQQLLVKMLAYEKQRQQNVLQERNQGFASTKSVTEVEQDQEPSAKLGQLVKQTPRYYQSPADAASYQQQLLAAKVSVEAEKKSTESFPTEEKVQIEEEQPIRPVKETKAVRTLKAQLRTSLETLISQLDELKVIAESEVKKLSHEEIKRQERSSELKPEPERRIVKAYDNDLRHYMTKSVLYS